MDLPHRNKSPLAVGTGAVVGKSIGKAFEESCYGPALAALRDRDVPCSSPWSTSDSSTPLDGSAKRRDAKGFSKASENDLNGVDDDSGNVHVMTISPDPSRRFEPALLRVPSEACVTWPRRDCGGISDRSKPELFVLRQVCPIVEIGWQAVRSFSLNRAQSDFMFKFEKGGLFVISSKANRASRRSMVRCSSSVQWTRASRRIALPLQKKQKSGPDAPSPKSRAPASRSRAAMGEQVAPTKGRAKAASAVQDQVRTILCLQYRVERVLSNADH